VGFDGGTNKIMKIVKDPLTRRVLFWFVIVLIYEAMESRSRMRRLNTRMYHGR
jgi:hypothetical protein